MIGTISLVCTGTYEYVRACIYSPKIKKKNVDVSFINIQSKNDIPTHVSGSTRPCGYRIVINICGNDHLSTDGLFGCYGTITIFILISFGKLNLVFGIRMYVTYIRYATCIIFCAIFDYLLNFLSLRRQFLN